MFVFRLRYKATLREFIKFQIALTVPLITNSILVPSVNYLSDIGVYFSQALVTVCLAVYSFFANKHFSFATEIRKK